MRKKPSFAEMTPAQRRAYTSDATKYNKRTTELQEEADTYERSGRVTDAMKSSGSKSASDYAGNSKAMYAKADRLQREVARRLPNTGTPTSLRNETGLAYDGGSLRRRGLTYAEFNDKGAGGPTPGDRADAKRRRENAERRSLKPLMDKAIKAMKTTKKAKGGKIDGCAVRGKTKAKRG